MGTMEGLDVLELNNKLQSSTLSDRENPPTPPPKDEISFKSPANVESYFNPYGLSRPDSVFSLSRASLANQLSQLTSINLPDAESLSSTISTISTASAAIKALSDAAAQIQAWIRKAAKVLGGLDAEDDVDWAAAGGRDGIGDVETAIGKFEHLVIVYIAAVEDVQKREDMSTVSKTDLTLLLDTLEEVITAWGKVNKSLKEVKRQVELAMEWEELWNTVIGEIGQEMEELGKLVFEMEERRHKIVTDDTVPDDSAGIDLIDLETIVEESPMGTNPTNKINHRFSLPPARPGSSPLTSPGPVSSNEDSRLLTLFARLQPLRASLDFLPMRLATFRSRAESVLPSACAELEARQKFLEKKYKSLEGDAETLRRELGDDRWVFVFRNAGRQAQKMCESVERGISKVREALDSESHLGSSVALAKKINDYEAKKNNYGPAIQKILSVIEEGLKERLTINGGVLRIHAETRSHWINIEAQIHATDEMLEEYQATKSQQMRDSISTIISNDISVTDSMIETPISSPASSVVMGPVNGKKSLPSTPDLNGYSRHGSSIRSTSSSRPSTTRRSGNPPANGSLSRRLQHSSPMSRLSSASPSPSTRPSSSTPTPAMRTHYPRPTDSRPRWNSSPIVDYTQFGHHARPTSAPRSLNTSTPSPYAYRPSRVASSTLPSSITSKRPAGPVHNRPGSVSSLGTYGRRDNSPSASSSAQERSETRPRSRLYTASTVSTPRIPSITSKKCVSLLPVPSSPLIPTTKSESQVGGEQLAGKNSATSRPRLAARPATSMAMTSDAPSGRRSSMLPLRKIRHESEERKWKA